MHVQPLLAAPSLMKAPGSSSRSTMSVLRRTPCPRVVPRITAQSFPPSSRAFYAGRAHAQSATMLSLQISSGENAEDVRAQATALIQSGRWQLCDEGRGMERTFKFKGFKSTWDFMNVVAAECQQRNHHPEWTNVYNTTHIRWTTHKPLGLSAKDTHMARFCDEAGARFGEKPASPSETA